MKSAPALVLQRGLQGPVEPGSLLRSGRDEGGTMPGSRGEHELQERFNNVGRAYAFHHNQVLDHLNPLMRE